MNFLDASKKYGATTGFISFFIAESALNFLEASETDHNFGAEIPNFVAQIKKIFEHWQLAAYLEAARETEPFDPSLFEGDDMASSEIGYRLNETPMSAITDAEGRKYAYPREVFKRLASSVQ